MNPLYADKDALLPARQDEVRVYRGHRKKTSSRSTMRALDNYDTIKIRKKGI
jgi:hypothetical protein